ncbi:MAG: hypothetical protein GF346_02305 [Candidatus Eisenbacteria bacterium]|nr:hypothetical protein [Candidatus Latescibacterota bacterium]MBD3301260.1 hypothetical protein [Candidatus Eisenbacteria bacterium]
MIGWTQILVTLRNADPTALTAEGALRDSLGFGDRLARVERRILWELGGPETGEIEPVLLALRRSGELWNPNKEAAAIRRSGEEAALRPPVPGEAAPLWTLAWDPDRDLARTPLALRPHAPHGWRLARGVLWGLSWRKGSPDEQSAWTEEAVLCAGPRRGLLVHPHLEEHRRIRPDDPAPWLPVEE